MHQELQRLKDGEMFLYMTMRATRCSRAVRTGYREWRIAGPVLFAAMHERNIYSSTLQDRVFDKWASYFGRASCRYAKCTVMHRNQSLGDIHKIDLGFRKVIYDFATLNVSVYKKIKCIIICTNNIHIGILLIDFKINTKHIITDFY